MLCFAVILTVLGRVCLAVTEPGTIGMGIPMYKPVCSYACHDSLSSLYLNCTTFGDDMEGMDMKLRKRMDMGSSEGTTSSTCRSSDRVWLETFAFCIHQNCATDNVPESKMESSWQTLAADGDPVPKLTTFLSTSPPTVEVEAEAVWLNDTRLVNKELYFANRQTLDEFAFQEEIHVRLGVVIMVTTVVCFLLGGVYLAFISSKQGSLIPAWVVKYITLPALVSSRHQVPLPYNFGYVPSRSLSLFISFYIALNVILCCVPYKSVWPDTYNTWFASKRLEISSYVANRTGVLSIANLALAILFAGRNNPIMWVTGFSQTTCITFHRWAARIATLQAVIHSIIYTFYYFWEGGSAAYYTEASKAFYWWGIIATLALFLGASVSVLPLRIYFYESFLITHILLAILALVATWYHIHLEFYERWGYKTWLYICFAFWLFDRFMRFARVMFYNWVGGRTEASAELLHGGEIIRLTVSPGRSWHYQPGQYTFLYFPGIGRVWESHPFSVCGWSSPTEDATPSTSRCEVERDGLSEKISESEIKSTPNDSPQQAPQSTNYHNSHGIITFLIRPAKGVTRALQNYLASRSPGPHSIEVLTEGPYGHTANLEHFKHILCIGGGIGITALLPYVQDFTFRNQGQGAQGQNGIDKHSMTLAWTANEQELVSAVREMIPETTVSNALEVCIKVTNGEEDRMNLREIIKGEVEKVEKGGRLAVVVCGPPGMADEIRRNVVDCVGENGVLINMFEESFTW